ncbi:hypothetical protein D3C72_1543130 [compost metagenome]
MTIKNRLRDTIRAQHRHHLVGERALQHPGLGARDPQIVAIRYCIVDHLDLVIGQAELLLVKVLAGVRLAVR